MEDLSKEPNLCPVATRMIYMCDDGGNEFIGSLLWFAMGIFLLRRGRVGGCWLLVVFGVGTEYWD